MVVLFADSGSTKTEWALSPTVSSAATSPLRFTTSGLNPCLMSDEDLQQALCSEVLPNLSGSSVDVVRFYGDDACGATTKSMGSTEQIAGDDDAPHA